MFLINLPLAALAALAALAVLRVSLAVWVSLRHVPESKEHTMTGCLDVAGPDLPR